MNSRVHIIFLRIAITALVLAGGIMLLSAVKTRDAKPCKKVLVHYKNGSSSGFVPENQVNAGIAQILNAEPVGTILAGFDLNKIEMELEKHPWVYDAQLYFDNNQTLHVTLDEAVPVARVLDAAGKSFYVDAMGKELPLSMHYRAELPVFTGVPMIRNNEIGQKYIQRICGLAEVISRDSFWMAQAAQIDVLPNGRMELIPAIGNHVVDLGEAMEPGEMLEKLKLFYKAIAAAGRLSEYSRIQAGFKGQVVAQKAQYVVAGEDGKAAMRTYQKMVTENKQLVDANSVVKESGVGRLMGDIPDAKVEPRKRSREKEPGGLKTGGANPAIQETEKPGGQQEQKKPKAIMPKSENN